MVITIVNVWSWNLRNAIYIMIELCLIYRLSTSKIDNKNQT